MRYSEEEKKIYLPTVELIALARRGIATARDYEKQAEYLGGLHNDARPTLSSEKEILGFPVVIYGYADATDEGELTLIKRCAAKRGKPTKAEREEVRGEGFILAYLYRERYALTPTLKFIYTDTRGEILEEESERPSDAAIDKFFRKCIDSLELYGRPEIDRVTLRVPSMKAAAFPYTEKREGQREFIRAVYRTIARGARLYATAPTGTGKTVSVLYPALKALGDGRCEKVFYLTPKHTTMQAAADCLNLFSSHGVSLRAVTLYSKESLCLCNGQCKRSKKACRLADFSRICEAVLYLYDLGTPIVTKRELWDAAERFSVCPHELSLCYSELCDFVICDFNYLFDPQVYLQRYFTLGGRYAILVDEAHNLPERAREMFSSELSLSELDALLENPLIPEHSAIKKVLPTLSESIHTLLFPYVKEELREGSSGELLGAASLSEIPPELYGILAELEALFTDQQRRAAKEEDDEADARTTLYKEWAYRFKKLSHCADIFDEKFKLFVFYDGGVLKFKLFCIDTGGVIGKRAALCASAIFFSATLEPIEYYRLLLGASRESDTLSVSSPFDPSQLSVSIVDKISTRYSERERTTPAVCRTIAAVMSARRGNYMIFCPSFEYLELVSAAFIAKYPKIHTLVQRRDMTPAQKREFLDEFKRQDDKYLVGFCVLGGIYSEGVDLAGDSLIGAVVVGIGMPTLSYEREAMKDYFADKYEAGTEYAYLYPGMNKVFQAAGRVIRREEDRGVIVLIDDRFRDPLYKKSIPALWQGMKYVGDAKELKARIEGFWQKVDEERQ